jgi:hypothetical protein
MKDNKKSQEPCAPKVKELPDNSSGSSSSDHTDRDGIKWGSTENRSSVRAVKDYHDSVVHMAVV